MKKVGYQRPGYKWSKSIARFKRTGSFKKVGTRMGGIKVYGLGHRAGDDWGTKKDIDPKSKQRRYSKNSPSFDEGVYRSKERRRNENESKMASMAAKMK
jgi:hypothetical protein